ncbi:hypothetical protein RHGRI_035402 [Rhododendron griersonianum]|uniref:S-protein homolog n=1 Tax=Rhododendron griersonianum TaxID=479676 RepID=A0AAV6I7M1_9ERIC|nr:hypothetical protein RHGRI_035402 [Rhododendron griersonianum]
MFRLPSKKTFFLGHAISDDTLVQIFSRVPDKPTPLNLRCQSKDDDIGYHTLHTGQDLHWSFNRNFWGTTLFFCHFYWGSKTRVFNVYDSSINYDVL